MSTVQRDGLRSWIYLVFIVFVVLPYSGVFCTFGVFYAILLEQFHESNSKTGWIGSIMLFCESITFPFTVYLHRRIGLRWLMVWASVIYASAFLLTSHMSSMDYLFITYSIPCGFANGLLRCLTVVTLVEFFDKYLGVATGIRFTAGATGPIIFSYLLPIIFDFAGWKSMINYFGFLVVPILIYAVSYRPVRLRRETEKGINQKVNEKDGFLQGVVGIMKNRPFLTFLSGNLLFSIVAFVPVTFMVQYAKTLGCPLSKAKWMEVAHNAASIGSRFAIGLVTDNGLTHKKLRLMLPAILILFGASSALCTLTQSFILMTVYMGVLGVLDGMFWVLQWLSVVEICPSRHVDIGFAVTTFVSAFGYLGGLPLTGWIYDVTSDFRYVLYTVCAFSIMPAIFILSEMYLTSTKGNLKEIQWHRKKEEVRIQDVIMFVKETTV